MNDKTYQGIAEMNETYGGVLLFSFQYRNMLKNKLQNAEGEAKEQLQSELYNLNEKIKSASEGRQVFTYAVQQENQRRAEAVRESPRVEAPVLEELAMVA